MAISKILHMKDSGNSFHARHLKRALDYVMNPEKTQGGRLVGAVNCQADMAFEQMMDTKKQFGKTDKRQGYHIILSFKEDEVEPDRAFEITQKFVAEYLGDAYEAVFVVHDNTDHVHSHIVFNSVSFVDGKKYRYHCSHWCGWCHHSCKECHGVRTSLSAAGFIYYELCTERNCSRCHDGWYFNSSDILRLLRWGYAFPLLVKGKR